MKFAGFIVLCMFYCEGAFAQVDISTISSYFVKQAKRERHERYIRDTIIDMVFKQPLDSNNEADYETACLAASQFMVQTPQVEIGFNTLFRQYDGLQRTTKASFLEAVYGLYPGLYVNDVRILLLRENNPKLFAMQVLYLLAANTTKQNKQALLNIINSRYPNTGNNIILQLKDYINNHVAYAHAATPPIRDVFAHQKQLEQKTVYSFQRWNRDYPGLAIVQNADGTFVRDSMGKLQVFEQLARSASGLPYFITDGNTPQGIYSVTGIGHSISPFLGPTPNLQMVMPFEDDQAYWGDAFDNTKDSLANYYNQLPASWQHYTPMAEAYWAGRVGRSAVIAHGTTLNPTWFNSKPYYPISPTLGCLCAREIWNPATGGLIQSDQLNLVNAFLSTPGDMGYVIVINLDDKQNAVSREEVEKLVNSMPQQ